MRGRLPAKLVRQNRDQGLAVFSPSLERGEARIAGQRRQGQQMNQRLEEFFLGARDRHPAIGGGEELKGHDAGMARVGRSLARDAGGQVPGRPVIVKGQRDVVQADVHIAAAAGALGVEGLSGSPVSAAQPASAWTSGS